MSSIPEPIAWLESKQVAALLGISGRTLQLWIAQRRAPPFYRIGARYRWKPADVEVWLSERRI